MIEKMTAHKFGPKLTAPLTMKMTQELRTALDAAAKSDRRTVSDFVRRVLEADPDVRREMGEGIWTCVACGRDDGPVGNRHGEPPNELCDVCENARVLVTTRDTKIEELKARVESLGRQLTQATLVIARQRAGDLARLAGEECRR
jgi:hypothetical protein